MAHQGGLGEHVIKNKSVKVFAVVDNPNRCVVRLYKKYMSLRPSNAPSTVLYLQPLRRPRPDCWYQPRAIGHNTLSSTIKKMCQKVGDGYFTNHSLRRTCATQLFHKGVDEQQIMSVTGHRSGHGVRAYKQISHDQQEHLSDLIRPTKKLKKDDKDVIAAIEQSDEKKKDVIARNTGADIHAVPNFNFSNCTVTLNYN